jgi:hypothetical protein
MDRKTFNVLIDTLCALFRAEFVFHLLVEFVYVIFVPVGHRLRSGAAQFRDTDQMLLNALHEPLTLGTKTQRILHRDLRSSIIVPGLKAGETEIDAPV